MHGLTVEAQADASATVKAPMVTVNADAVTQVKGGAMVQVSGPMVMLG